MKKLMPNKNETPRLKLGIVRTGVKAGLIKDYKRILIVKK